VELLWVARYDYSRLEAAAPCPRRLFSTVVYRGRHGPGAGRTEQMRFAAASFFLSVRLSHGLEATRLDGANPRHKIIIRRASLRQPASALIFPSDPEPRIAALLETMHAAARQHEPSRPKSARRCWRRFSCFCCKKNHPQRVGNPETTGPDRDDLCGHMEKFLRENCAGKSTSVSSARNFIQLPAPARRVVETASRISTAGALELSRHPSHAADSLSDYELKRIAEATGFATVHHFTRVFTRIAGVSPARWLIENGVASTGHVMRPGFVNPR